MAIDVANIGYVCPTCQKECKDGPGLKRHITRIHTDRSAMLEAGKANGKQFKMHKVGSDEDLQEVVAALFPDGIPPHKIVHTLQWYESTKRLIQE